MHWLAALVLVAIMAGCAERSASGLRLSDGGSLVKFESYHGFDLAPATRKAIKDPRFAAKAAAAPHIYMALQPNEVGSLSIIFAIDAERDVTPENDPAIRLTPEHDKCNPQALRHYSFPAKAKERPIFGPDEAVQGVTARQLPAFMAMAVTSEMLVLGIATSLENTHAQNVCTRKLWEQLIASESIRMDY